MCTARKSRLATPNFSHVNTPTHPVGVGVSNGNGWRALWGSFGVVSVGYAPTPFHGDPRTPGTVTADNTNSHRGQGTGRPGAGSKPQPHTRHGHSHSVTRDILLQCLTWASTVVLSRLSRVGSLDSAHRRNSEIAVVLGAPSSYNDHSSSSDPRRPFAGDLPDRSIMRDLVLPQHGHSTR
eukprot:296072-Prymnesium_polylepis.1